MDFRKDIERMNYQTVHRDKNHKQVQAALQEHPDTLAVIDTARMGDGFPDLVWMRKDADAMLIEVKSEIKSGAVKMKREIDFMLKIAGPVDSTPRLDVKALEKSGYRAYNTASLGEGYPLVVAASPLGFVTLHFAGVVYAVSGTYRLVWNVEMVRGLG